MYRIFQQKSNPSRQMNDGCVIVLCYVIVVLLVRGWKTLRYFLACRQMLFIVLHQYFQTPD